MLYFPWTQQIRLPNEITRVQRPKRFQVVLCYFSLNLSSAWAFLLWGEGLSSLGFEKD